MINFPVGCRVLLDRSPDEDLPEEWGRVLWQSPEDPMLYVVLVDQPLSDGDHRHRLVAEDCISHGEYY